MPYNQEDQKKIEDEIAASMIGSARLALNTFFVTSVAVIIGTMMTTGMTAGALGVLAVSAPVLALDISETFSITSMLAHRLAKYETGFIGKIKDILVSCGNKLYEFPSIVGTSPASQEPPADLSPNDPDYRKNLKASIDARMVMRFLALSTFVLLTTAVVIGAPYLLPVMGVLAGAYIFSTLACRTADNVKFIEQSKQDNAKFIEQSKQDNAKFIEQSKQALVTELGIMDEINDDPYIYQKLITQCIDNGLKTKFQIGRNLTTSNISGYDNLNESERKICEEAKELYTNAQILAQDLNTEVEGILRNAGYEDTDIDYQKIQLDDKFKEDQKLLTILIDNGVTTKDELRERMQTDLGGILKKEGANVGLLRIHGLVAELHIEQPSKSELLKQCFKKRLVTKFQIGRNLTTSNISGYDNLNESERKICEEAKELYAQARELCEDFNKTATRKQEKLDIYKPEHQKLLTILINNGVTTKDELGKKMQTGLRGILVNAGVSNDALVKCEKASNSFLQISASATTIQNFILRKQSSTAPTSPRANELERSSNSTASNKQKEIKVAGSMGQEQETTQSTKKAANQGMDRNSNH